MIPQDMQIAAHCDSDIVTNQLRNLEYQKILHGKSCKSTIINDIMIIRLLSAESPSGIADRKRSKAQISRKLQKGSLDLPGNGVRPRIDSLSSRSALLEHMTNHELAKVSVWRCTG